MTRTSRTAFLLFASLGALLALWALFPGQPGVDAPEPGTSPACPAPLGPESRPAASEPAPRALLPEATPLEPDAAEDVSGHCRVRVVQKEGGQPAPGATVFLRRWARLTDGDQEAFLARHGDPCFAAAGIEGLDQAFIADAGGRVLLPAPGLREDWISGFFPAALAAARWGELASGFVKLPEIATGPIPEILLEVGPEQDLEVQTVDAAGRVRPGVPVGLFGGAGDNRPLQRAVTAGEQALARFPNASRFVQLVAPRKLQVGLDFPMWPEERCLLDVAAERSPGPLRLVCPPTGSVALNLVEEDGRPIEKRAWVLLARGDEKIPFKNQEQRRHRIQRSVPAENGTVAFPLVGLGVEIVVQVFFEDRASVASDRFRGPWMPGQEIVHTLRCPRDRTFSGRLWAPDGSLAANRRILVSIPWHQEWERFTYHDASRFRTTVRSDSGGHFSFGVPGFVEGAGGLRCRISLAEDAPHHRAPWAILRTPPSLEPGNVSIGEVRLQAIPIALAGRVVDPCGKPLTGVSLACEARIPESKGEHPTVSMTVEGPDADGAFTAYGPRFHDTLTVRATKKGFTKVLLSDIGFGERNLVIVMGEATRFSCPVLLDPELADTSAHLLLSFFAKPRTGPGDPIRGRIIDGRASVTVLSPGRYDFVFGIWIGGQIQAIKAFEDIAIVAGPNPLPGLPGEAFVADLRGLFRLYTLFVHDSGGKQVHAGFEDRDTLGRGDGTIQTLILPGEAPDLVLVSPGRPSKRVAGLPSGSKVQMDS